MSRKLFIAINLPENIKAEIRKEMEMGRAKNPDVYKDARMIPEENWHITLKFLGNKPEEQLKQIEQAIRDVAEQMPSPEMAIQTLITAPPHRPPRMLWVTTTTRTNQEVGLIKKSIEQDLAKHGIFQEGEAFSIYRGHITLARLPEGRRIAEHIVSFPTALSFRPTTIDLMESHLESEGAEYSIVKSIDFKPSI